MSEPYFCPIFKRDIASGKCLDINHERLGYFRSDSLHEIKKCTGLKKLEVDKTCEACPNLPLKDSEEQKDSTNNHDKG